MLWLQLFIGSLLVHATNSLRCDCSKTTCVSAAGCLYGTTKDACSCCDVCAKGEGEICGGKKQTEGECGVGLQCIVRNLKDYRNRKKEDIGQLIGRCEHDKCNFLRCPLGQTCHYVNGIPRCGCPKCVDMLQDPVCGVRDGRDYPNECALRRSECEAGRVIGLLPGPCLPVNTSRIICNHDSMTVEISKLFLAASKKFNPQNKNLSLFDPKCVPQENSTHYIFTSKLNTCSTKRFYTLTSVIYSNAIRTVTDARALIVRNRNVLAAYECDYSRQMRNSLRVSFRGSFTDRLPADSLVTNSMGLRVRRVIDSRIHVRAIEASRRMYLRVDSSKQFVVLMRINITRNVSLTTHFCYVTPSDKNKRGFKYTLVKNGCPTEYGVKLHETRPPFIKLTIPGLLFSNVRNLGLVVRCKIRTCIENITCLKKCQERRKKRDTSYILNFNYLDKPIKVL